MDIDLLRLDEFPPATREQYEQAALRALGPLTVDRLRASTLDGIEITPLGSPRQDRDPVPGRGAGKPWSIVQRVLLEDPEATNARIHDELAGGADAIDLVIPPESPFAGPRIDPDSNLAEKLMRVFAAVHLNMMTVHFTGCAAPADMMRALLRIAPGHSPAQPSIAVRGGWDPFASAMAGGGDLDEALRGADATLGDCMAETEASGASALLATRGQVWHSLGASDAQQLAITIASGGEYLRRRTQAGRTGKGAAELAAGIEFRLVADHEQYMTMARLRAFRRLWALVLDAFGIPQVPAFVHAEPAWRFLTMRDPWTNILRSTIAAFAAAAGGADAITTVPHTVLLGRPDAAARRLSRNVQTILMDEVNLHRVGDPAAGAGGLEDLTDALAEAAWREFQVIEREGGIRESLRSGALGRRVADMDRRQREMVARRAIPITGTSTYPHLAEKRSDVEAGSPMPPPFPGARRLAEPFERLRDRSDAVLAAIGTRPRVFLATLGPVRAFAARAGLARNLLEAGGFEVVASGPIRGVADAVTAFKGVGTTVACLCGDDESYRAMGGEIAATLSAAGASRIVFVGEPAPGIYPIDAAEHHDFVHAGTDVVAFLENLQDHVGTTAST